MPYRIFKKIVEEIKIVQKSGALSATVILTYVGIDTMAYLSMPLNQEKNNSKDFINWVNKYMRTSPEQSYEYNANDMWAARCGTLHSYSSFSKIATQNNYKLYGYHNGSEHLYNPQESIQLVLISIPRLVNDFILGIQAFLRDALNDKSLKKLIDSRIEKINQQFDILPSK